MEHGNLAICTEISADATGTHLQDGGDAGAAGDHGPVRRRLLLLAQQDPAGMNMSKYRIGASVSVEGARRNLNKSGHCLFRGSRAAQRRKNSET